MSTRIRGWQTAILFWSLVAVSTLLMLYLSILAFSGVPM